MKLLFTGQSGVGKTCLIRSMMDRKYKDVVEITWWGVEETYIRLDDCLVPIKLFEIGGAESAHFCWKKNMVGDADMIVVLFDITDPESLELLADRDQDDDQISVSMITCMIENKLCPKVPVMLVGTKSDLRNDRNTIEKTVEKFGRQPVTKAEGLAFAKRVGYHYMETSALTGENMEIFFKTAARLAVVSAAVRSAKDRPFFTKYLYKLIIRFREIASSYYYSN